MYYQKKVSRKTIEKVCIITQIFNVPVTYKCENINLNIADILLKGVATSIVVKASEAPLYKNLWMTSQIICPNILESIWNHSLLHI